MVNPDLALAESVSTTNASYFIVVYILILIYCCFGLAVVCDVYFVPALQKLSESKYTNQSSNYQWTTVHVVVAQDEYLQQQRLIKNKNKNNYQPTTYPQILLGLR